MVDGRLVVFDREIGQRESRPAKRTFAQQASYTVRDQDEQPIALAEILHEALEDKAARLHRRLLEGESPARFDQEERSNYAFFLAAQVTRGEAFRAMVGRLANTVGKQVMRVGAQHIESWWPNFVARMKERGEELPDVRPEEYRDVIVRDEFDVAPSPEHLMEMSLSLLPDLAAIIFDFAWHAVHLPEPMLLTPSGRRPSPSRVRSQRASARSVFARRLRPRRAAVSLTSARCRVAPADASARQTKYQPVQASTATWTSRSGNRPTHSTTAAGVESILPVVISPVPASRASKVIWLR